MEENNRMNSMRNLQGQPKRMPSPLLHNIRVVGPRDSMRYC
jgi:hypothetical protein